MGEKIFFVFCLAVAECKIAAFNGVRGIMIRETAETLGIITQDDKFHGNPSTGRSFKSY